MPAPLSPLDVEDELRRLDQERERLAARSWWDRNLDAFMERSGLRTAPVRAAANILGGASDLVGAGAAALRSTLAGLPNPVQLTEEGRAKYGREAYEAGARGEAPPLLDFDLLGDTYETPGAGRVAAEGISLGGQLAGQKAVEATSGRELAPKADAYDPTSPSGLRRLPGAAGTVAAVGEAAAGFALDLPFDPVEMRVARSATGLARAEGALQTASDVVEAERVHRRARAAYEAAEAADRASAAVALPGTIAGTLEGAEQSRRLAEERGLADPEAAGALTETVLSAAFAGSMARSLARPDAPPARTEDLVAATRERRAQKRAAIRAGLDEVVDGLRAQEQQAAGGTISTGGAVRPADPQLVPATQVWGPPAAPSTPSTLLDQDLALDPELQADPEELDPQALLAQAGEGPPPELELVEPGAPGPETQDLPGWLDEMGAVDDAPREDSYAAAAGLPGEADPGLVPGAEPDPADPALEAGPGELGEVVLDPATPFFVDDEPQEVRLLQRPLAQPQPQPQPVQEAEAAAPAPGQEGEAAGGGGEGAEPASPSPELGRLAGGGEAAGVVQAEDGAGGGEAGEAVAGDGAQPEGGGGEGAGGGAGEGLSWKPAQTKPGVWHGFSGTNTGNDATITQVGEQGFQAQAYNESMGKLDNLGTYQTLELAQAAAQAMVGQGQGKAPAAAPADASPGLVFKAEGSLGGTEGTFWNAADATGKTWAAVEKNPGGLYSAWAYQPGQGLMYVATVDSRAEAQEIAARAAGKKVAKAPADPRLNPAKAPAAPAPSSSSSAPEELSRATLTPLAGKAGGNEGGSYLSPSGRKYYIKPQEEARAQNEVLAGKLYEALGIRVPKTGAIPWGEGHADKLAVHSELIPDLLPVKSGAAPVPDDAWRGFAADAWLANWDVVGVSGGASAGNLYRDKEGRAVRIDHGGALLYRAMGVPKGEKFGPTVGELETLRDPKMNSQAAKVFGGMTPQQLYTSMQLVSDLPAVTITELVNRYAPGGQAAQLLGTLLARQNYIRGKMGEIAKQLKGTGAGSGWLGGVHQLSQESVVFAKGQPPSSGATPALVASFTQEQAPQVLLGNIAGKEPPAEDIVRAGHVVLEPDGRVWVVHREGKTQLPRGNVLSGNHPARAAVETVWRQTGLSAEPLLWLGDFQYPAGENRLYVSRRVGGDPSAYVAGTTEGVSLLPLDRALQVLSGKEDKAVLEQLRGQLQAAAEAGHPDILTAVQALAGKPKPPSPPVIDVARYHGHLLQSGIDPKSMSPVEWKRAAEAYALQFDPKAQTADADGKPSLPSWMDSQAKKVEELAARFKTQKALKQAIAAAKAEGKPEQEQKLLDLALAFKKKKTDTQILRDWFKAKLKKEESFRKWWRRSKVVDSKGLPAPMYHGTTQVFGDFDPSLAGQTNPDPNDYLGFYFSPSEYVANSLGGSKTLAAVLSIQNPYVVTVRQMASFDFPGVTAAEHTSSPSKKQVLRMKAAMEALGYDGVRVVGSKDGHGPSSEWYWDQWVPFRPDQIHAITHPNFKKSSAYVQEFAKGLQQLAQAGKAPLYSMAEVVAQTRQKLLHALGSQSGEAQQGAVAHDLGSALFEAAKLGVRSLSRATSWAAEHLGDLLKRAGLEVAEAVRRAWPRARQLWAAHQARMAAKYGPGERGSIQFGGGGGAAQPNPPAGKPAAPPIQPQAPQTPLPKPPKGPTTQADKAATRQAGQAYDAPPSGPAKGKPGGEPDVAPNLERLGLPDDQTQRLRALMEEIGKLPQGKGGLDRARPEHWDDLDRTVRDLLRVRGEFDFRRLAASRNLRAAEVQAFKTLLLERAVLTDAVRRRVEAAQVAALAGTGSQEAVDRLALDYMAHKLEMVANLRAFANDGTAAARALAARRRVMEARGDFEKAVGAVFKTLGKERADALGDAQVAQLAQLVQDTLQGKRDEASLLNAMIAAQKPGAWDKLMEAWKAGLLSGVATKIANNLGNSTNLVLDLMKDPVAAAFDWARAAGAFGLGKQDRTRFASDLGAALSALRANLGPALAQYRKDWTAATLYRPEAVELSYEKGLEGHLPSIGGKTGRFVRSPYRKLQAADDLFKHLFRAMETARQANRLVERWIQKGKVPRAQKGKVLDAVMADIHSPQGAVRYPKIMEAAARAATTGTFQDKPGTTGQRFEALFSSPLGKYLQLFVPFRRTPLNIAKATFKLTPGGVLLAAARMKGLGGAHRTPDELTDDMARGLVGTVLLSALIALARAGYVTGSGPADDDERKLLESTGWKPNSLVVTHEGRKHYVPMGRFEPIGALVGIAGDLAQMRDLEGGKALFQRALQIVVSQAKDKTYFEGANNITEFLSDPERYGASTLKSLGGSVVPTLVASFARGVDPVYRETASAETGASGMAQAVARTIQARLPFASRLLPAKRTATGEGAERGGNFVTRFALPTTLSPEVRRPVEEELLAVGYAPSAPKRETTVGGKTIRLNDAEYRELFRARERAAERLARMLDRPSYRALPATEEEGGQRSREAVVRRIYSEELAKARKAAYRLRGAGGRGLPPAAPPPPRAVFR